MGGELAIGRGYRQVEPDVLIGLRWSTRKQPAADIGLHLRHGCFNRMIVVLISPEEDRSDEHAVLHRLFGAGLARFHVRKPHASIEQLCEWIEAVDPVWRPRLVLHQHHELVARYGLGGRHWKDDGTAIPAEVQRARSGAPGEFASRSCHDLVSLRGSLGVFDAVFFGPVFASISKPGYGPKDAQIGEALGAVLAARTAAERRTSVIALGGVTIATAPRALTLGFDGVAALGTVWQATDPVTAYRELVEVCARVPLPAREEHWPLLMRSARTTS